MAFDPYHKWLGIRPEQGPPTHYQLLGISPDEKDPEVIEEAAIRQTAHVRSYQIGPHGAMATRLLNEISQARTVLLNPTKRKDYEAKLTRSAPPKAAPGTSDTQAARQFADLTDTAAPTPVKTAANLQKGKNSGKKPPLVALVAGGIALLVVVIGLVVIFSGREPANQQAHNPDKAKGNDKQTANKNPGKKADKETVVKIETDKRIDKVKADDGKKELVVKAEDKELATKFVGAYKMSYSGAGMGKARWQFTEDRAIQDGNDKGTWRIEDGKVVLTYTQPRFGQAVLEFKDDNTLVGQHKQMNGQVFNWVLEREEKSKPPDPIVTGPEASGPSPLDKLEPEKIAVEDRVQKIPELVAVLKGPKSAIFGIAFSPDGKKLACACDEGQLYFWDLSDGKAAEGLPLGPMGGSLNGLAFSADGKKLVCAHQRLVRIYDVTGPEPKGIREIPVKVAQYPWVAWSPDGNTLALTDHDGGVRLLDWVQDKEGPILRGHAGQAKTVYFSRDGKSLLSAGVEGKDGRVIVWDMTKNPPAPKDNSSFGGQQLWHAVFSPDEKKVAFGANDGSVRMLSCPKLTTLWSKKEHRQFANSVCFAPDGKTLISTEGGFNSQGPHYLVWWNAANGDVIKKWELPERCSQGVFAPSGLYVALTNHNHKVYILRLKAG